LALSPTTVATQLEERVMIINKVGATLLGALCFAALAFPTAAAAQSSTFVIPFDRTGAPGIDANGNPTGAFINPCTAELVDVTGASTITTNQRLGNNGVLTTTVGVVTKGSGIGQISLMAYTFNESQSFSIKSILGDIVESDFFDKLFMKGAGKTDNWVVRARFRIKIGPDGTVQVSLVRINDGDQCKG
jgi:hypothetical protein